MDNQDFVTYYLAKLLKKCGYDEPCRCYYDIEDAHDGYYLNGSSLHKENHNSALTRCSAPSLWQAQKWLRYKKNIEVNITPIFSDWKRIGYDWNVFDDFSGDYTLRGTLPFAETYEAALSAGIEAALKLIQPENITDEKD